MKIECREAALFLSAEQWASLDALIEANHSDLSEFVSNMLEAVVAGEHVVVAWEGEWTNRGPRIKGETPEQAGDRWLRAKEVHWSLGEKGDHGSPLSRAAYAEMEDASKALELAGDIDVPTLLHQASRVFSQQ